MTARILYAICDDELPARAPLASATDYEAALAEVARLHEQFRAQAAANGEGSADTWQRLRIDERRLGQQPTRRHTSSVNGCP